MLDEERGIIQPSQPGNQLILYMSPITEGIGTLMLAVSDESIRIMKIDPILASLRLDPTSIQAASTLGETEISLEILSGLFFFEERSEVTVSVILENGHRFAITDPSEIQLQSSDSAILMVDSNYVVARGVGTAELNVTWITCGMILGTSTIEITVEFNDHRPIFVNNPQIAQIVENSPLDAPVATVSANDLDFANNTNSARRDTEYRFADGSSTHDGLFVLDKTTGVITLNGPLDREARDSYVIQVEATDRAQRLAEQQRRVLSEEGDDLSGSGSGGSADILIPDGPSPTPLPSLRIDMLVVSLGNILYIPDWHNLAMLPPPVQTSLLHYCMLPHRSP